MKKMVIVLLSAVLILGNGCGKMPTGSLEENPVSVNALEESSESIEEQECFIEGKQQESLATDKESSRIDHETDDESNMLKAQGKYRGLHFTVTCETAEKMHVYVNNTSSDGYALGWVNGSTITCRTSETEAYCTVGTARVLPGGSIDFECYFGDISGTPDSVLISNVLMLNSQGLPQQGNVSGEIVEVSFKEDEFTEEETEPTQKLYGESSYEGLVIEATGDRNCIRVTYKNNTPDGYSLGWVYGPTITCITTEGEYYTSSQMALINAGQEYAENYYFDAAAGDLLSICISNINSLGSNGLPVDFSGGGTAKIEFQESQQIQ